MRIRGVNEAFCWLESSERFNHHSCHHPQNNSNNNNEAWGTWIIFMHISFAIETKIKSQGREGT